jgi:phosphoenolpyruvate carboxylase
MSLRQKICDFLFSEFELVVREKEPKIIQHAIEFTTLSLEDREKFFNQFTKSAASQRYTFDDLAKVVQYFSVRQILSSIADHTNFIIPLSQQNCFLEPIEKLQQEGHNIADALEIIKNNFYSRAVFTGHPTEFASDETIELISGITELIIADPSFEVLNKRSLRNKLEKLFSNKLIPRHKLSVEDEIARNLKHLHRVYLYIPKIRQELSESFSKVYGANFDNQSRSKLDSILINSIEFRSWTGGDADGNFRIISDKMAKAINLHKHAAAKFHLEYFNQLVESIHDFSTKKKLLTVEPFIKDLALDKVLEILESIDDPNIKTFILLLKIFGKNVAAIDVRQNMYILSQVVADILSGIKYSIEEKAIISEEETNILKILKRFEYHKFLPRPSDTKDKKSSDEVNRIEILNAILDNPKIAEYASNLNLNGWFKERYAIVTEELSRMQMITVFPKIFQNYIISNSEGASSVLQMIFLAKICSAKPHIVPLFETKESLDEAHDILNTLLQNSHYKKYLTGKSQKVMVGYSDSQKDNGICVLPLIAQAIQNWQELSKQFGISIEVFHGNGLDLARGGPRIVEKEQTFQGSHIRYTFLNFSEARSYFAKLLKKSISSNHEKLCDLTLFVEEGCLAFSELRSHKGYFNQLEKYFQVASPFELFVKTNNFSSRPSKRNASDVTKNPYDAWFKDLVLDSEDIINGMRAIPWIITIEGTFTYFNLWYGFKKGIDALKGKYDIKKIASECPIFREIIKKVLIAIEYTDFDLAWHYFPAKDRPKSKSTLTKLATKAHNHMEKDKQSLHFLAMLNQEFNETKDFIKSLKLDADQDVIDEIKFRKKESLFIRSFMAWLNLKLVGEPQKIPALFANASEQVFESMCGSVYLGFNEYRTVTKSYINT